MRPLLLCLVPFAAAGSALAATPLVVTEFQCRGEQPLWGLAGTRVAAVLSTATPKGKREVVYRGAPQVVVSGALPQVVWRGESTHLPKDTLVVLMQEEACRSPLADGAAPLTHRAILSLRGSDALTGCCSVKLGPPAPVPPKSAP